MKVTFQDFYGQYVTVSNGTASGNIRLKVRTHSDLNKISIVGEEGCDIETDISLDEGQLNILFGALQTMMRTM